MTTIRVSHRKHAGPIPEGWHSTFRRNVVRFTIYSLAFWGFIGLLFWMFLAISSSLLTVSLLIGVLGLVTYSYMVQHFLEKNGY